MTWAPCPHGVRTRGKKVSLSPFPVTGLPSLAKARAQTLNEYLQYSACCSQEKSLVFIRDQGRAPCPGSCAAKVAIA